MDKTTQIAEGQLIMTMENKKHSFKDTKVTSAAKVKTFLVSSPDSLFVFWVGREFGRSSQHFVPALECRLQVLVCRFGSVRYMNLI